MLKLIEAKRRMSNFIVRERDNKRNLRTKTNYFYLKGFKLNKRSLL